MSVLDETAAIAVAKRHGLSAEFGSELLVGHEAEKAESLAAAVAATYGPSNPVAAEFAPLQHKLERDRAVLTSMGMLEEPPEASPDPAAPSFDGGVREPAPGPSDPNEDHNELIADLLSARSGSVRDFWDDGDGAPPFG